MTIVTELGVDNNEVVVEKFIGRSLQFKQYKFWYHEVCGITASGRRVTVFRCLFKHRCVRVLEHLCRGGEAKNLDQIASTRGTQ